MSLLQTSHAPLDGIMLSFSAASGITLTAGRPSSAGSLGWRPQDDGRASAARTVPAEPAAGACGASWTAEFRKWLWTRYGEPRHCIPILVFQSIERAHRQFARIRCYTVGSPEENLALAHVCAYNHPEVLPFLLDLYLSEKAPASQRERIAVLELAENYLVRRLLIPCQVTDFARLHAAVMERLASSGKGSYLKTMAGILAEYDDEALSFPDDEMVRQAIAHRNWYAMSPDVRSPILARLENARSGREELPVLAMLRKGKLTIEHIMPQNLNNPWYLELGPEASDVHRRFVNSIANLTVSAYNQDYGQMPFRMKRDGFNAEDGFVPGYRDSPYWLNRTVACCEHWTKRELAERLERITERFLSIWPDVPRPSVKKALPVAQNPIAAPESNTAPAAALPEQPTGEGPFVEFVPITESNDRTLCNRIVVAVRFERTTIQARTWRRAIPVITAELLKRHRDAVLGALASGIPGLSLKKTQFSKPISSDPDIWMDKRGPVTDKLGRLHALFVAAGVPCEGVGVLIEPADNGKRPGRYALVPLKCSGQEPAETKAPEAPGMIVELPGALNASPTESAVPDEAVSQTAGVPSWKDKTQSTSVPRMTLYVRQTPAGREIFLSPRARTAATSPCAYARLSALAPEFLQSLMLTVHEDDPAGGAGRGVRLAVSAEAANDIAANLGCPVRFVDLPAA